MKLFTLAMVVLIIGCVDADAQNNTQAQELHAPVLTSSSTLQRLHDRAAVTDLLLRDGAALDAGVADAMVVEWSRASANHFENLQLMDPEFRRGKALYVRSLRELADLLAADHPSGQSFKDRQDASLRAIGRRTLGFGAHVGRHCPRALRPYNGAG